MKSRKQEILDFLENELMLEPLVDEMVFLEGRLDELKKLPFIKVHPQDPTKQKVTPAARQYRESVAQYSNIIRILMKASGLGVDVEDSPLRKWFDENVDG